MTAPAGTHRSADHCVYPLSGMKQFAAIERKTGGCRTERRTELVGAQHQMRWQTGCHQGGCSKQSATTGDGVYKTRDERNDSKNGEGGQVDAEFKRHGGKRAYREAGGGRMAA